MPERRWLASELARLDIAVGERLALAPWPPIATAFRLAPRPNPDLERAAAFERVWSSLFPGVAGEAWSVAPAAHAQLFVHKPAWRRSLPSLPLMLGGYRTELHAFHLPDAADAAREADAINRIVARSTTARRADAPSG